MSLTQPQKLSHEVNIDQDPIRRQHPIPSTSVGHLTKMARDGKGNVRDSKAM